MGILEFSTIQIFAVILAAAIIYYTRMLYKKGNFERRDLWMWYGFSVLLVFAAIIPTYVNSLFLLFTKRSLDALLIFGLLFSFGLTFQLYARLQQTNKEVTELVRKVALKFEEYKKRGK